MTNKEEIIPDTTQEDKDKITNYLARLMVIKGYNQNERNKFIAGFQTGVGITNAIRTDTLDIYIGEKK